MVSDGVDDILDIDDTMPIHFETDTETDPDLQTYLERCSMFSDQIEFFPKV